MLIELFPDFFTLRHDFLNFHIRNKTFSHTDSNLTIYIGKLLDPLFSWYIVIGVRSIVVTLQ